VPDYDISRFTGEFDLVGMTEAEKLAFIKADQSTNPQIITATDTVITASDEVYFGDVTDSSKLKKDTVQGILDLVPAPDLTPYAKLDGSNQPFTGDVEVDGGAAGSVIIGATGSGSGGIDEYTVLMMQMDADPFVDSSVYKKTITNNNVTLATDRADFNGSSAYFSAPDSNDFYFGTDPVTFEACVTFDTLPSNGSYQMLYMQRVDGGNFVLWGVFNNAGTYLIYIDSYSSGVRMAYTYSTISLSTGTEYHLAFTRVGNNFTHYRNGTALAFGGGSTTAVELPNIASDPNIGRSPAGSSYFDGKMRWLRVSKGIARWTSNFTPPNIPYSADLNVPNLIFKESGVEKWRIQSDGADSSKLKIKDKDGDVQVTIEQDTGDTTFNGDISAANLSGENTGDQDLSGYLTLDQTTPQTITATDTTITASDEIYFGDATDSFKIKKDTIQGILDLIPTPDLSGYFKLDQTTPQTITAGRPIFSAGLLSGNTVSETTLIGENAGISITSAVRNIAIGKNALDANLTGNDNIAIGVDALTSMTSAENIAIGNYALKTTAKTLNNVAIGHRAGENINSQNNVFLGSYAGRRLNTSQQNIGIGSFALGSTYSASATGSYNVAIGVSNGEDMTTGYENTLIGFYTGVSLTTGYRNTMVGSQIAKAATTGYRNIIMGELAYTSGTNLGYDNVVLGYENVRRGAGASTRENVLIGGQNAYANIPTNATYGNVFIGYAAAYSLSTGYANAGIGHYSLNGVVDGYKNSSLGSSTLFYCGSGYENVAIGYYAGRLINSGGNSGNLVQSTLLGAETRTNAAGDINSIVIGYAGRGKGSNTAVIGNENTTGLFLPADNYELIFGAGDDCGIKYDGTNMVINPKKAGSGYLNIQGQTLVDDKLMFTQTDGNEYIDSLADGYMDYGATTQHRFNNDVDVDGDITADAVLAVHKAADGTSAVADGTYTVGIGGTTNGTITIKDGIITAVQEAVA
jgi:hypothetical protein